MWVQATVGAKMKYSTEKYQSGIDSNTMLIFKNYFLHPPESEDLLNSFRVICWFFLVVLEWVTMQFKNFGDKLTTS